VLDWQLTKHRHQSLSKDTIAKNFFFIAYIHFIMSKGPDFAKLNSLNYTEWAENMDAWLRANRLIRVVNGSLAKPSFADPSQPTDAESTKLEAWQDKADAAAGWIVTMLEPDQRVHLKGINDDPVLSWKKLEEVHMVKKAGSRFNAWDDLFNIRKKDDETLSSMVTRIDGVMNSVKNLRPSNYDLDKLDEELTAMTMIRALPEEYNNLVASLLIMDKLDKASIMAAFQSYEAQARQRATTDTSSPKALAAATHPHPHTHVSCQNCNLTSTSTSTSTNNSDKSNLLCDFCGMKGHLSSTCWRMEKGMKQAKEDAKNRRKQGAKQAQAAAPVVESAGHASLSSTTLPSQTHYAWNADTGATSHMTPHHQWLVDYTPHCVPIKLADDTIVYSAGVGSVLFKPLVRGKELRTVKFSKVLHVPSLGSNLLSVLFLTKHRGFKVLIDGQSMDFMRSGETLFTAPINKHNAAYLSGTTVDHSQTTPEETAKAISTLPVDLELWHRRYAHHYTAGIQKLVQEKLVTGLTILSKGKPGPVCEPCLSGKMHANPFPSSETRASKPLELVHTDVHGPLSVQTLSGYRYWYIFVDDYTRF
jgi:hypothetical protein